jgi:hypothetical protein
VTLRAKVAVLRPVRVFPLIVGEAALLTIVALGLGTALLFGLPAVTQSVNTTRLGVFTPVNGSAAAKRGDCWRDRR